MNKQNINIEGYDEKIDISGNNTIIDDSNNVLVISKYKILPYCDKDTNSKNLKSCKFYFKDSNYSSIFSTIDNRSSLIEDKIFTSTNCFNADICNYILYSLSKTDETTFSYIYMPTNVEKKWNPITFQIIKSNVNFLICLKMLIKDCKCKYNLDKTQKNVVNIIDPVFNLIKIYFKKIDFNTNLNVYNFSLKDIISIEKNDVKFDLSIKYMYCKLSYNGGSYYCICKN